MTVFSALTWKDLRLFRNVFAVGIVLAVLPYALNVFARPPNGLPWGDILLTSSVYSCVVSVLTTAIVAGNAVACERMDHSDEFLAYLPPTRSAVITSKLLLTCGYCVLIWAANLIVYSLAISMPSLGFLQNPADLLPTIAATTLLVFGGSWFFSCTLNNTAHAAFLGLSTPIFALGALSAFQVDLERAAFLRLYDAFSTIAGLVGIAVGVAIFVRRS